MKTKKNYRALLIWVITLLITPQMSVFAQVSSDDIATKINNFYSAAIGFGGIAAMVMVVYGALYITLSGASPDKQREGKDIILSAITGLILLFAAYLILQIVNPQIVELKLTITQPTP